MNYFTFTFMYAADTFIQSELQRRINFKKQLNYSLFFFLMYYYTFTAEHLPLLNNTTISPMELDSTFVTL